MGKSADLVIKLIVDNSGAASAVDSTASSFDKFQSKMSGLAGPAAVAAGAIAGFGLAASNAASDTQQAMGAVESVFGSAADGVIAKAEEAATAVGLSKSDYMELAAVSGAAFKTMGLSAEDAAAQSDQLIGIGADLSATFGGSTADAVAALQAAFRGEADAAEKYGLSLSQSAVDAKLAEMGMDGLTGAAADAAKQQAIMALITEQSADAQGQFASEADTAAGAQQIANASFQDAASDLGTALLPAVTFVTEAFASMAQWVSENTTLILIIIGVIGTLAAGILAINAALTIYRAVQTVATAATWLSNAAWLASPITWIIVGIAAIVAGIILLWKNCEGFRNIVTQVWEAMKSGAITAWNAIKAAISAVVNWAKSAISAMGAVVNGIWTGIKAVATTVWNAIKAVVAAVVNGIKAYLNAVKAVATAVWNGIRSVATTAWNGIKAVVSGVVNSIKTIINGIRSAATSVFNTVKNVARSAFNAILGPVRAVQNAFDKVVGAVRNVIDWIGRIKIPEINLPFGLGSTQSTALYASAAATPYAAAGARSLLYGRVGPQLLNGGPNIVINVRGTLNDTDSARAVKRVLRNDSRRRGGVVIGATA